MAETSNLIAWRRLWPALLAVSVVALLPVGYAFEAPLAIAAALGLVYAWRMRDALRADPGVRLAAVLFACYWLAALISAPAAVAPGKTWSTVAGLLRFLPFALFAVLLLRDFALWPQIECAVAAVVVLWLLDAWVQIFTGYSIAGAMEAERLSGIFGAGNLKLGPVLAVLSPFVLAAARDRYGGRGLVFAAVFMLMPVLLAGSRAAWLMYALVVAVFMWQQTRAPLRFAAWGLAALVVVGLAAWSADRDSPAFASRVQRTLLMLRGTPSAVDEASAGRLRIWSTAGRMIAAHPVAGVGVRGFRFTPIRSMRRPATHSSTRRRTRARCTRTSSHLKCSARPAGSACCCGSQLRSRRFVHGVAPMPPRAPARVCAGTRAGGHVLPAQHAPGFLFGVVGIAVLVAARALLRSRFATGRGVPP